MEKTKDKDMTTKVKLRENDIASKGEHEKMFN